MAPQFRPAALQPATVPAYGELELPGPGEEPTREGGLNLDDAIGLLIRNNLNIIALRHEIPMADADVLTASLRANPIFYADTQLQPYGTYSRYRVGGPQQYDVNVTIPLDVTHKRKARTASAVQARRVTEAQLQDAVRLQIDNLYTVFVDAVAAEETLRFSRTYAQGITRILNLTLELYRQGQVTEATVDTLRPQQQQAELQVAEATQAVGRTNRALGRLLNMPPQEAGSLQPRDTLRQTGDLPQPPESLLQLGVSSRPDLAAFRLGVQRAQSDVRVARAERYSDVYLLAQPYTFQDNRPFGLRSATSWAIGLTATLPLFNRNQGNIARAQVNVSQTQVELAALERQVVGEVDEAVREFQLSRDAVLKLEQEILPAAQRVRDANFRRLQGGEINALEYLEAQRDYNEVVRLYRDALVRHRRSMLDLNTAVGIRVLP